MRSPESGRLDAAAWTRASLRHVPRPADRSAGPAVDPLARLARMEGVASAMAAARDGIDALLHGRGLRGAAPDLTAESLLRGAHASAVLDGSPCTLEELRAGDGGPVARAALRTSAEVLSLVSVLGRSPLQAVARLHTL